MKSQLEENAEFEWPLNISSSCAHSLRLQLVLHTCALTFLLVTNLALTTSVIQMTP